MNVGNKPTAILSQNSSEGIQSSPCGTSSILAFWGRARGVAHGASPVSRCQSWLGCEWREMWCWYSLIRINIHWILMQPIWNTCHLYTPNSQANKCKTWWKNSALFFKTNNLTHMNPFAPMKYQILDFVSFKKIMIYSHQSWLRPKYHCGPYFFYIKFAIYNELPGYCFSNILFIECKCDHIILCITQNVHSISAMYC